MVGSTPPRGACACVCEQPCRGVGVSPQTPPRLVEAGGDMDTFVSTPPAGAGGTEGAAP